MPERPLRRDEDVSRAIVEILLRLESLEETRRVYVPKVDALVKNEAIQEAVKSALKAHNKVQLTVAQKVGGALIGAIAFADFVRGLTGHG